MKKNKCHTCKNEITSRDAKKYCSRKCFHARNGDTFRCCITCKERKLLSEFDKNKYAPQGRCYECKSCRSIKGKERWASDKDFRERNRDYLREYRKENKEQINKQNKVNSLKYKERNASYIFEIKKKGCSFCGYDKHPSALQFHHTDPTSKKNTVGFLTHKGAALETLKEEIAKCILLCANCHAEHHNRDLRIK